MSVNLTIKSPNGTINLTQYLTVEQGAGMEPGDPQFTEKVFARSLLKTGATLALEHLREKEMIFPLKLKAATKVALANLVRELNIILNTPGARVEWQDEGASQPTFFDLISGQFDDEFDYRLSEKNWLKGKLRLFTGPLGYKNEKGPRPLVVSNVPTTIKVGTSPVVVFNASGPLAGDGAALMQVQISSHMAGMFGAVSVLSSPSFTPWVPITAAGATHLTFLSSATAPGPTYGHWIPNEAEYGDVVANYMQEGALAPLYAGDQRILLSCRTPFGGRQVGVQVAIPSLFSNFSWEGPVATVGSGELGRWELLDLGVVSSASGTLAMGMPWNVGIRVASMSAFPASSAVDVAGIIVLPEAHTCWFQPFGAGLISEEVPLVFDGVTNTIHAGASMGVPASGIPALPGRVFSDVTLYTRGAIPQLIPAASPPIVAVLALKANGGESPESLRPSFITSVEVAINVLERTRYVF